MLLQVSANHTFQLVLSINDCTSLRGGLDIGLADWDLLMSNLRLL